MKSLPWKFAIAAILLWPTACSDVVEESYATWAEADKAGAVERGWLPSFVPSTVREIHDTHDLDTNAQTLVFTIPLSDIQKMKSGLRLIVGNDSKAVAELARASGMSASAVEAYAVCSRLAVLGDWPVALLVNRETGKTLLKRPVEWVRPHCTSGDALAASR